MALCHNVVLPDYTALDNHGGLSIQVDCAPESSFGALLLAGTAGL